MFERTRSERGSYFERNLRCTFELVSQAGNGVMVRCFWGHLVMGQKRRRIVHTMPFRQRLIEGAARLQQAAEQLPLGVEREALMKRAKQAEAAIQINDWLAMPGSEAPAAVAQLVAKKRGVR